MPAGAGVSVSVIRGKKDPSMGIIDGGLLCIDTRIFEESRPNSGATMLISASAMISGSWSGDRDTPIGGVSMGRTANCSPSNVPLSHIKLCSMKSRVSASSGPLSRAMTNPHVFNSKSYCMLDRVERPLLYFLRRHHIAKIALVIAAIFFTTGCEEPMSSANTTCPRPVEGPAGIQVASHLIRVMDVSVDGKCLLVASDHSSMIQIVDAASLSMQAQVDIKRAIGSLVKFDGIVGGGFIGREGDSILVSAAIRDTGASWIIRTYLLDVRKGQISRFIPSRCLPDGWDPVLNAWFEVKRVEHRSEGTVFECSFGNRYHIETDEFWEPEIPSPPNSWPMYTRTSKSGIYFSWWSSVTSNGNNVTFTIDDQTIDVSGVVRNVNTFSPVIGTDWIIAEIVPVRYSDINGEGWGPEIWLIDASSNATLMKRNLRVSYCKYGTLSCNPIADVNGNIYLSMHADRENTQLPYRIRIADPTHISLIPTLW